MVRSCSNVVSNNFDFETSMHSLGGNVSRAGPSLPSPTIAPPPLLLPPPPQPPPLSPALPSPPDPSTSREGATVFFSPQTKKRSAVENATSIGIVLTNSAAQSLDDGGGMAMLAFALALALRAAVPSSLAEEEDEAGGTVDAIFAVSLRVVFPSSATVSVVPVDFFFFFFFLGAASPVAAAAFTPSSSFSSALSPPFSVTSSPFVRSSSAVMIAYSLLIRCGSIVCQRRAWNCLR
mmetsp:Transcript_18633/g.39023  ORF Transcript_18633/g.39023 Transcript_18633/m.39023 type:complete len:235 (+) Transcript_18633:1235-1939(+)